jgi:hypothetical protein
VAHLAVCEGVIASTLLLSVFVSQVLASQAPDVDVGIVTHGAAFDTAADSFAVLEAITVVALKAVNRLIWGGKTYRSA